MLLGLCIVVATHLIWAAQPTLAHSRKAFRRSPQKPTGRVAASWYPSWHAQDVPLSTVNWTEYNMVMYSFAATTSNSSEIGLQDSDKQLLPQFVTTAKNNGAFPILSIGGWDGSRYFSSSVATDANCTAFATTIVNLAIQYQLSGIEFDWEYPNRQGNGCNVASANDTANLLSFLQTLRGMAPNLILSATVLPTPFLDANGTPLTDVSAFAQVLDYIEILNYDAWGSFSTSVGPNAPLNDTCSPAADQEGSAVSAVVAWTRAKFPVNQIILGVPSYGHSFRVNNSDALDASGNIKLFAPFNKIDQPAGDKWDDTATGVDVCGNPNVVGGIFSFWGLIETGFLRANGTPSCEVYHTFDECSQTPFVYNSTSQVMVSYDDAISFAAKGQFIHDMNLAGFAMYETGGDYNNTLVNAIRSTMN